MTTTDHSAEVFFQSFLHEAMVSSSSISRDVHSDVVHSAFLLSYTIAHLPGCLKHGFGQAVVAHDLSIVLRVGDFVLSSRRFREHFFSGTWPQKPGSFSQSQQGESMWCLVAIKEDGDYKRLVQLEQNVHCQIEEIYTVKFGKILPLYAKNVSGKHLQVDTPALESRSENGKTTIHSYPFQFKIGSLHGCNTNIDQ